MEASIILCIRVAIDSLVKLSTGVTKRLKDIEKRTNTHNNTRYLHRMIMEAASEET